MDDKIEPVANSLEFRYPIYKNKSDFEKVRAAQSMHLLKPLNIEYEKREPIAHLKLIPVKEHFLNGEMTFSTPNTKEYFTVDEKTEFSTSQVKEYIYEMYKLMYL